MITSRMRHVQTVLKSESHPNWPWIITIITSYADQLDCELGRSCV